MDGHETGDNWRKGIVSSISWRGDFEGEYTDGNGVDFLAGCGDGIPPDKWPIVPNAIFGKHDYVGPFLVACDHGCYHTGDHATSIDWGESSEDERRTLRGNNRRRIANLCRRAMIAADVLFFWFDGLDAYGTLAELVWITTAIGMRNASSKKYGIAETKKYFFVASPSFDAIDEMWLTFAIVNDVTFIPASSSREALVTALALIEEPSNYSPIEKMFIEKWRTVYGNGIVPQYNVPGFSYRVDFAFPDDKVAVELDGYEYHNSKEQFTNDRKRQREMELTGWRFIRFSGSEVYKNTGACVLQAYEFWQSLTQAKA